MPDANARPRPATARDLRFYRNLSLWTTWPFLPAVRRRPGQDLECGVLYDCWTAGRRGDYSATVFLTNIFIMPSTGEEFLALPKEVFDTPDEVAAAGRRLDRRAVLTLLRRSV
jgi:hypothetical protein